MPTPDSTDTAGHQDEFPSATAANAGSVVVVGGRGGGQVGEAVAAQLQAVGTGTVTLVTDRPPAVPPEAFTVHEVPVIDAAALDEAGLAGADVVVVLGTDDAQNLLVVQLARVRFGVDRVLVRVNDPDREPAFDRPGVDTFDATATIARGAVDRW